MATPKEELGLPGVQIDLLIDRNEQVINFCQMKYSSTLYVITQDEEMKLRTRMEVFRTVTHTPKAIHMTMVTIHGLVQKPHAGIIQNVVTMDDLFERVN